MTRLLPALLFILSIKTLSAQELEYKQALDSLARYLLNTTTENNFRPMKLLSWYAPGMMNSMEERCDSTMYLGMTDNNKTKIVLSDEAVLYMLDLTKMDTLMAYTRHNQYFCIKDSTAGSLRQSNVPRVFNGKYGGIPCTDIRLIVKDQLNGNTFSLIEKEEILNKIILYLNQTIRYSKQVNQIKKNG
ncbi:hypothetical protein [Cytophaga hutchinsonii]|uniref:DUF4468 domain-containing protein n=1 Tax=Cytophaga hutchinsonii (strain ATCC 33406 / DSM 1761 / CIP 103989 / NBRC 15051 / NCIMB 9469 / D465) TaxID=269798 RepID=A0A6N4SSK9_CYTH3|nr:hypothetical protein [Cytophaga hutchinsonii]ABG59349.1 hypothetical protein CHU_2086 [Cytophaga hutchinsonii ATCC 33406]SFX92199.1 hypothetical protein SAMN04487930_11341 [Cytophaga hutchinsonii ATCC 33406]